MDPQEDPQEGGETGCIVGLVIVAAILLAADYPVLFQFLTNYPLW